MNEKSVLRIGIVGAGGIAQAYSQAFEQLGDAVRLVAVADTDASRAEAMASIHGAAAFSNHRQLLAETDLDGVIICTPPISHPEHCVDFLRAGVHTLCEKPVALNSAIAKSIVDVATETGTLFTMASKFRFVPDVIRAKEIIDEGGLGEIVLYENVFASFVDMSKRWNSDPSVSGGGVLIDNGTHSLDIMQYLLGPVTEIRVIEGKRIQPLEVEDTVNVFARTADGVIGSIDLSWSLSKQTPFFISVYGTLGTLQVGWRESQFKLQGESEWTRFGNGYNKIQAFVNQILNFAKAIRGEESLIVNADEALASVAAVDTAYASLAAEEWTPVGN
ncbi:MAG: Gfo/Idh/MocA family oxidoreductase [Pirellulaceae bacterium]